MKNNSPIIMIGLDGAEVTLIERFCSEGKLPTLQSLRKDGCFGILNTDSDIFAGGVWPTFYTSKKVPWHGIFHNKLWRHENMRCEVANEKWLSEQPFWEILNNSNYKLAILDVPMTLGKPKPINGIHVCGWGTHDLINKGSWPLDLWKKLEKRFGSPNIPPEFFGPQSLKTLKTLREDLLKTTEQVIRMSEYILTMEQWDLFLLVIGATHRAGHYLWDLSQIDSSSLVSSDLQVLEEALLDIYQACDHGVGKLLEKAPNDAKVLVFAVHGMDRNPGWSDYSPKILSLIQHKDQEAPAKSGFLYRLRQVLPWQLIRQITKHMPKDALDLLVSLWSANMFDWPSTHYFPLPMDNACYIRINVKGREPQGIVEYGPEYHQICEELKSAFLSFQDIDSGKKIVDKVYRIDDLSPSDSPYRDFLPDLVITWTDISAIQSKGIRSSKYGEFFIDSRLPSGRAGNHTNKGWFVAQGEGISPATSTYGDHIIDIVPTVFQWLSAQLPDHFQGKPISSLCKSL
jgi:predicted AlkP superfamily phosphohydrolase/phosphomutase